ncbi:pyridoxamine 5'-phosphate oxidase family protein [Prauserella cavernicola]|uniref:Pyridoxamine 5'-phosphate oxidase family protein n=1 Tax=Prauserella cavernicola TaxID=2800127 RepID=A0A934QUJ2_9PSEU|nr:pyridoxamine 5'-phosphate oxidase family protein [Prauserella cavernicola]MBK1786720.1 pyridoxamine 5'-phosphate oxidase family protein [Prauserella cavernicola]
MTVTEPATHFDSRYSDPEATATEWPSARRALTEAPLYWLSTVRPGGRPHTTPLIGVWHEGALYFCTGAGERKNLNLEANPWCALITGRNDLAGGTDLVVEGRAERERDEDVLRRVAAAYLSKYGEDWRFSVRDNAFVHGPGVALVYAVSPTTVFGFAKGPYGQTRWSF